MATKTKIEWTDFNWNFIRGCLRVSEGCRNCYAEAQAIRGSNPGGPYHNIVRSTAGGPRWTGELSFHEDILLKPLGWTKPRKIFVNSMSDLFYEKVTDEMIDKAFAVMALTPRHVYQVLTKRQQRMRDYMNDPESRVRIADEMIRITCGGKWEKTWRAWTDFLSDDEERPMHVEVWPLPHVWLGVSVEDQKTADERIPLLLGTPAAVRWISAEPLLGPIRLDGGLRRRGETPPNVKALISQRDRRNHLKIGATHYLGEPVGLDWGVIGGESGPRSRPCDIENIRSLIAQFKAAGVPVFVKQLGANPLLHEFQTAAEVLFPDGVPEGVICGGTVERRETIEVRDRKGGDINEWPADLRVREYPAEVSR